MNLWLRRASSFEAESEADTEFWRTMSADERVAILEQMRQEWIERSTVATKDFEELFGAFLRRGVRFVIVGLTLWRITRDPGTRRDLDVLLEPSVENAERVLAALDEFGFWGLGLARSDFDESGRIVQLGMPPNRIDLMTRIDGVTFEEVWSSRVEGAYGKMTVSFIGYDALLRNKAAAGRPQDLADLETLKRHKP